tara:strand:- start:105 stop:506 length:402 start_codon:yes stop_codon:yes gene_type:complete
MTNKSKKILSEISAGELLDKISILEIKLGKIDNKNSLNEINKEYKLLKESQKTNIEDTEGVQKLFDQIKAINLDLWDIEDKIRICEKNKDFGKNFIELARKVYLTNDKRSKVKSKINEVLGSNIKEIKHYEDY